MSPANAQTREHPPARRGGRLALAAALALCAATTTTFSPPTGSAQAPGLQAHPNIVVITTDDQSLNMLRGKYMAARLARLRGCSGIAERDPPPEPGSSYCE